MRRIMRNQIAPNMNGYVLSPFGSIDGFGDFGDNPTQVITGVASPNSMMFQRNWSGEDFLNNDRTKGWWAHITYWKIPGYDIWEGPPDENIMTRAADKYNRINQGIAQGSGIASAMGNQFIAPVANAIKAVDANTQNYDWVKVMPGDGLHTQRVNVFNALKKAITTLANCNVPPIWSDTVAAGDAGQSTTVTGAAAAGVSAANTQIALLQQQQLAQAAKAKADLDAANAATAAANAAAEKLKATGSTSSALTALGGGTGDNTLLYVGGGLGLVALLGVGIILSRKKKAA